MSKPLINPLTLYLNRAEMNCIYRNLVLFPLLPRCNERLRKRVDLVPAGQKYQGEVELL